MGLDMYLRLRRDVCLKKGRRTVDIDDERGGLDGLDFNEFGVSNRIVIEENFCYWRKANAVHKWFVDTCAGGKDECQPTDVSLDDLHDLHTICKRIVDMVAERKGCLVISPAVKKMFEEKGEKIADVLDFKKDDLKAMLLTDICYYVINDKALVEHFKDMLPTTEGFFFGSMEYDGTYVFDAIKTVLMLENLFAYLKMFEGTKVFHDIIYQASW